MKKEMVVDFNGAVDYLYEQMMTFIFDGVKPEEEPAARHLRAICDEYRKDMQEAKKPDDVLLVPTWAGDENYDYHPEWFGDRLSILCRATRGLENIRFRCGRVQPRRQKYIISKEAFGLVNETIYWDRVCRGLEPKPW